jgi:hypothetical protein
MFVAASFTSVLVPSGLSLLLFLNLSKPCHGNIAREAIYERIGDGKKDLIRAWGNFGRIHANTYSNDKDRVYGLAGDDFLYVNDGDTLDGAGGGSGFDWCFVDAKIEAANTCDRVVVR